MIVSHVIALIDGRVGLQNPRDSATGAAVGALGNASLALLVVVAMIEAAPRAPAAARDPDRRLFGAYRIYERQRAANRSLSFLYSISQSLAGEREVDTSLAELTDTVRRRMNVAHRRRGRGPQRRRERAPASSPPPPQGSDARGRAPAPDRARALRGDSLYTPGAVRLTPEQRNHGHGLDLALLSELGLPMDAILVSLRGPERPLGFVLVGDRLGELEALTRERQGPAGRGRQPAVDVADGRAAGELPVRAAPAAGDAAAPCRPRRADGPVQPLAVHRRGRQGAAAGTALDRRPVPRPGRLQDHQRLDGPPRRRRPPARGRRAGWRARSRSPTSWPGWVVTSSPSCCATSTTSVPSTSPTRLTQVLSEPFELQIGASQRRHVGRHRPARLRRARSPPRPCCATPTRRCTRPSATAGPGPGRSSRPCTTRPVSASTCATTCSRALAANEFHIHVQPLVDLTAGRTTGAEALLRWQHPERGLLTPGAFLDLAEETGMMRELGHRVLREACRRAQAWPDHTIISVNLSRSQLLADDQLVGRGRRDPAARRASHRAGCCWRSPSSP